MFALLHYDAEQPARGTELLALKWDQACLVFCFLGYVNVITMYNKTQMNSECPRLIFAGACHLLLTRYLLFG
jgi:hypothetical protein